MIIAGVTTITSLRKASISCSISLWEGLNWLLEEERMNRGGAFRPTCRYVFDYHPEIGVIVTIPFVCARTEVPLFSWLAKAIAAAC